MNWELLRQSPSPNGFTCEVSIPPESPYFEGHFPDQPVFPGVAELQMLLEIATECLHQKFVIDRIENVGFRRVVTPGEALDLQFSRPQDDGSVFFELQSRGRSVSRGTLRLFSERGMVR